MEQYDSLKLSNQVCFPLYVASKEIMVKYNKLSNIWVENELLLWRKSMIQFLKKNKITILILLLVTCAISCFYIFLDNSRNLINSIASILAIPSLILSFAVLKIKRREICWSLLSARKLFTTLLTNSLFVIICTIYIRQRYEIL